MSSPNIDELRSFGFWYSREFCSQHSSSELGRGSSNFVRILTLPHYFSDPMILSSGSASEMRSIDFGQMD